MSDNENEKKEDKKVTIKDFLEVIVFAAILYLLIHIVFQTSFVSGPSMIPTYEDHDRLLVYKLAYTFGRTPERGDIIVFHPPLEGKEDEDFIKRVIGLPGEQIDIADGKVKITTVDGEEIILSEPYLGATINYECHIGSIPEGCYFVLGDNRNISNDSHYGWYVTKDDIIGRAFLDFWPLSEFGLSPNARY